ncbi:MAG: hypothetical protein K6T78_06040 [Alicyclobacillus sp.]|nr:hypothetical protein [Alicyclobacillus sp.]
MEWSVSLALTTLLIVAWFTCIQSVWNGARLAVERSETWAMEDGVIRVLGADVHAALSVHVESGALYVDTATGDTYRYAVNGAAQLVRLQVATGGVSVVAAHVTAAQFAVRQSTVQVKVTYGDGTVQELEFTDLEG